jgi:tetratricopeptide (TPR) repeat protein
VKKAAMEIAIDVLPNHPRGKEIVDLIARAISLRHEKRHEEALGCLDEAVSLDPKFFPVLVEKGIILFELARYDTAIETFDLFLKCTGNSQVRKLRDSCLEHSLAICNRSIAEGPPNVDLLLKRGSLLQRLQRFDDAVYTYNLALEIHVNTLVEVINRRGNALLSLDRPEEALESYNRALELSPCNAFLLYNRGNVLQKLSRMDEALRSYDQALLYKPDLAEARMEQSHCRLAMGDYRRGFQEYESRWDTTILKPVKLASPEPLWLGKEPLAGKTILLWAEQGFGDAIQFMRYVPLVAQIAGHTILRVPTLLKSLAATVDCPVTIITFEDLPPHDFHCPLMSLPLAFGTTLESIPADVPYLRPKPDLVEKWKNELGPRARPRIGLVWAGRRREPINLTRDMGLQVLAPLTGLDVEIISLQKEIPDQDRAAIDSMPQIIRLGEKLTDFEDTAALIQNLDMVISVDTVVAHLAGALGKPVWIMLRRSGEWRWLLKRSDSLWYPTARIFRQTKPGDWAGVADDVVRQLRAMIESSQRWVPAAPIRSTS